MRTRASRSCGHPILSFRRRPPCSSTPVFIYAELRSIMLASNSTNNREESSASYYFNNHSNLLDRNRHQSTMDQDDGELSNPEHEEGSSSTNAGAGGNFYEDDRFRPRQRRRQPPEAKKVCRVCGDKAFSVNFNVVTCESCKAFFRRNALKTKELRCQTSGNCDIGMQTRRSCKKCRLKKCFEVGMIKEWIMSDEARMRKRQLIEKNREKRQRLASMNKVGGGGDGDDDIDLSDMEMDQMAPMSNESNGHSSMEYKPMEYKPMTRSVPQTVLDYSPLGGQHSWQSPPASVLIQQASPSSSSLLMFPRTPSSAIVYGGGSVSTSAQVAPSPAAIPTISRPPPPPPPIVHQPSTSMKPMFTILPTEPATPSTSVAARPNVSEETIRVPKTLLAALINQCHSAVAVQCQHVVVDECSSSSLRTPYPYPYYFDMADPMSAAAITPVSSLTTPSSTRPSVIVPNKSTPLKCICRCRCGSKATYAPMGNDDSTETCEMHLVHTSVPTNDGGDTSDDSGAEMDPHESSISRESCSTVALIGSSRTSSSSSSEKEFVLHFNFGMSSSKFSHLEDLLSAFGHHRSPIGRSKQEDQIMPMLPPIDRIHQEGDVAGRLDTLLRRMIRFCKAIAPSSSVKRKVLTNLVRRAANDLLLWHSVMAFVPEADSWYDKGPNIRPIGAKCELQCVKGGVYNEHLNFIQTFPRVCKNDVAVVLILCAMTLFNPDRVEEKDRDQVLLMRRFYEELLTQYLESKFDLDKAQRLRTNLMEHLQACSRISDLVLPTVILELNDQDLEPMLIETLGYKY